MHFPLFSCVLLIATSITQSECNLDSEEQIREKRHTNRPKEYNLTVTSPREDGDNEWRVSWWNRASKGDYKLVYHSNQEIFNFENRNVLTVSNQATDQRITAKVQLMPDTTYWFLILHPTCNEFSIDGREVFPCASVRETTPVPVPRFSRRDFLRPLDNSALSAVGSPAHSYFVGVCRSASDDANRTWRFERFQLFLTFKGTAQSPRQGKVSDLAEWERRPNLSDHLNRVYEVKDFFEDELEEVILGLNMNEDCSVRCDAPLVAGLTYQLWVRLFHSKVFIDSKPIVFTTEQNETFSFLKIYISVVVVCLLVLGIGFIRKRQVKIVWDATLNPLEEGKKRQISLVKLEETVRRLLSNGEELLAKEFKSLKEESPTKTVKIASLLSNKTKNRYVDILPYDQTRVTLSPFPDDPYSDYINASYVHSFTQKKRFIATQGPKETTKQDFWRMIWEKNVYVVVMVTSCIEGAKNKCSKYWPDVKESPLVLPREDLIIYTTKESTKNGHVVRRFQIHKGDDQRSCLHYQFVGWPDMGCPASPHDLVSFVTTLRIIFALGEFPVIVHCSAGVGRTGTLIGLHNIMQELDEGNAVNIYDCVLKMRNCRMNMVQTQKQYAYLYLCALAYYEQKKRIQGF